MKLDRPTILHRKDEHGVIVESGVFGPDDEVPEGFGPETFEPVANEVRLSTVEESKLTPWESPVVYQGIEVQPDESQVNEGTPVQAREELTEAEQEAFDALQSDDDESEDEDENEVNEGSPVQAKEAAGVELTESESKPGEESESAKSGRRRSSRS
jgi:hypothetical protein